MNISTSFLWDLMWKCLHRNPRNFFFLLKDSLAFAIVLLITVDSHQTLCSPLRTQEWTQHAQVPARFCCTIFALYASIRTKLLNESRISLGVWRVHPMILYAITSASIPYTLKALLLFRHSWCIVDGYCCCVVNRHWGRGHLNYLNARSRGF